jgi:hypothetical protein
MADKCCQCAVKTNANDSTVCDCCKMRMHYRCTDLTDDDINFLRRSKSTQITILCKSCKSGLSSVRDLKLNIESLQLSLNQRLSAIETAIKSPVISKDQKEEIIRESVERSLRAANIILANVPETSNDQDVTVANDILECIDPSAIVSPENVTRIGKKVPNHPRLLKLKLKDVDMARMVLKRKKALNSSAFSTVRIFDDQTPYQRNYLKHLRAELNQRVSKGENLTIKYINNIPKIIQETPSSASTSNSSNLN